ncbi:hypothetical protein K2173_009924 [Erythroxylum novogranatense]|uniref:Uncharacterized protein n=1 Tax=Erythroxylum novogranatense TaxID=1862640 RepID=A0AAV8SZT4_9ROSI|nr:hypothetical protein K2173_009924 [Erythroxylum novogranatense]
MGSQGAVIPNLVSSTAHCIENIESNEHAPHGSDIFGIDADDKMDSCSLSDSLSTVLGDFRVQSKSYKRKSFSIGDGEELARNWRSSPSISVDLYLDMADQMSE